MASTIPDRVSMPVGYLWLLRLGCPLVGFGLGFAIGPFVRWVSSILQSAPAPLRLAAEIPTPWLVPILTVIGIGAGYWLAQHAERGTHDPHEADYRRWIDGHPDLDHPTNALLRARRKALGSGNRVDAEEIHDQLQDHGIVVRDRDKTQQYRRLTQNTVNPTP